jgi:5-methylcytosine-specific restriction endonuclease McrA
MRNWSLAHVPDHALLRELSAVASRERAELADVLVHIAEVDARRLYLSAAFSNMHAYCVGELRMSDDAAFKRIRAARAARDFPALFDMVEDGRLHLTAVVLLAPNLTPSNASELCAAAAHKTRAEIELLLADRFPCSDALDLVSDPLAAADACSTADVAACDEISADADTRVDENAHSLVPEPVDATPGSSAEHVGHTRGASCRFTPSSSGRYLMCATVSRETHDRFRRLQALLSHAVPSGDVDEVLGRAFDAAIQAFERRRFAKREQRADDSNVRPRRDRLCKSARHIPADIRRAVHERDGARCTFVSATGRRCEETRFLQFDHILPLARGGTSTAENLRLRCRAHNQFEAERMFGAGFMAEKRASARSAARVRASRTRTPKPAPRIEDTPDPEVVPWLLALGFKKDEAHRAAVLSRTIPDAPLEARFKIAVRSLAPRSARKLMPVATARSDHGTTT